jgi:hypothetical protein
MKNVMYIDRNLARTLTVNHHHMKYFNEEKYVYRAKKRSTFSSDTLGTMIINIKDTMDEKNITGRRVKFKEILIHFYIP